MQALSKFFSSPIISRCPKQTVFTDHPKNILMIKTTLQSVKNTSDQIRFLPRGVRGLKCQTSDRDGGGPWARQESFQLLLTIDLFAHLLGPRLSRFLNSFALDVRWQNLSITIWFIDRRCWVPVFYLKKVLSKTEPALVVTHKNMVYNTSLGGDDEEVGGKSVAAQRKCCK